MFWGHASQLCYVLDDELRDKTLALARLQEEEEERAPTVHVEPLLPARARPSWCASACRALGQGLERVSASKLMLDA